MQANEALTKNRKFAQHYVQTAPTYQSRSCTAVAKSFGEDIGELAFTSPVDRSGEVVLEAFALHLLVASVLARLANFTVCLYSNRSAVSHWGIRRDLSTTVAPEKDCYEANG